MRVAACLVTRGDVPLDDVIETIPEEWEIVVWNNAKRENLAVYGRYAAISLTDADVIYVQDDDAVTDPAAIATAYEPGKITANMPGEFRHDFYTDHCLVGFGAIFDRGLPDAAFSQLFAFDDAPGIQEGFRRTCDIPFTMLTPYTLVAVEHRNQPWAFHDDRMWKQASHFGEREQMRQYARKLR